MQRDGQRGHVRQLQRHVPGEPWVDEAGRGVREQPEPTEARLALQPGGQRVAQRHPLVGAAEHELTGMQEERLVGADLDETGEVRLLHRGVDDAVLVVVEEPEELVDPDVHAAGLHHRRLERVQHDLPGVDGGTDVPVGEQHGATVAPSTSAAGSTLPRP